MTDLPDDVDSRWLSLEEAQDNRVEGVWALMLWVGASAVGNGVFFCVIALFVPSMVDGLAILFELAGGTVGLLSLYLLWCWFQKERVARFLGPLDVRVLPQFARGRSAAIRLRRLSKTRVAIALFSVAMEYVLTRYGQDESSAGDGSAGAPSIRHDTIWSTETELSELTDSHDGRCSVRATLGLPDERALEEARQVVLAELPSSSSGFMEQARAECWLIRVRTVMENGFHTESSFTIPEDAFDGDPQAALGARV